MKNTGQKSCRTSDIDWKKLFVLETIYTIIKYAQLFYLSNSK